MTTDQGKRNSNRGKSNIHRSFKISAHNFCIKHEVCKNNENTDLVRDPRSCPEPGGNEEPAR